MRNRKVYESARKAPKRTFKGNGYREEADTNFTHGKPPPNDKVLGIIKPIYEELTSDELLKRFPAGSTENNRETLNSLLQSSPYNIIPKGK